VGGHGEEIEGVVGGPVVLVLGEEALVVASDRQVVDGLLASLRRPQEVISPAQVQKRDGEALVDQLAVLGQLQDALVLVNGLGRVLFSSRYSRPGDGAPPE
jgi:hypothetical protein